MSYVALCVVCLLIAGLFLVKEKKGDYVSAVLLKALASLAFVILGFLARPLGYDGSLPNLLIAGLCFGCAADVMLNLRHVLKKQGKLIFLVGILVFLCGHILYLAAVLPLCRPWLVCVLVGLVLTALLMKWIFSRITAEKAFKIFGVVYIGAIVVLNCVAIGNLITIPGAFTGIFAAGALLFLVSDIVLILNTFGGEEKFSLRVTNISLYYVGQLLIALSLLYV